MSDIDRYEGEDDWPATAKRCAKRLRVENADLRKQLTEAGPRPARYTPDFTPIDGANVFLQWKGTNVCLDFWCECGACGHFDGGFAYAVRCGACGRAWLLPHSVTIVPVPDDWESSGSVVVDVDMDTVW